MINPHLSPAEYTGLGAVFFSGAFFWVSPLLVLIPLGAFLLTCFAAPFIPGLGFFLPVISRGPSSSPAVALTFDDGPDPQATPDLLALLQEYDVPATFFVIGQKSAQHPELLTTILAQGHNLGNHSHTHDPLLTLRSPAHVRKEINLAQLTISQSGCSPLFFRPPVGITSPRLKQPVQEAGLIPVTFRRRSADFSNTRVFGLAERTLKQVRSGDIIALHDTYPGSDQRLELWLREVESLIVGLQKKGLGIVSLAHLVDGSSLRERKTY